MSCFIVFLPILCVQWMDVNSVPLTGWKKYRRIVRRNFASVIFPVVVFSTIFFDWSRTRRFKKQQAVLASEHSSWRYDNKITCAWYHHSSLSDIYWSEIFQTLHCDKLHSDGDHETKLCFLGKLLLIELNFCMIVNITQWKMYGHDDKHNTLSSFDVMWGRK